MRFSNLTIRTKLLVIIGLITFVALLLAISVQFLYERHTAKQTIAEEIGILAKVIADRSTAAMMFNDQKVASENLVALFQYTPTLTRPVSTPRTTRYLPTIPERSQPEPFAQHRLSPPVLNLARIFSIWPSRLRLKITTLALSLSVLISNL